MHYLSKTLLLTVCSALVFADPFFQPDGKLQLTQLRLLAENLDSLDVDEIIHVKNSSSQHTRDIPSFLQRLLFPKIPTAFSDSVGQQCKDDSIKYLKAVLTLSDVEALKMYDAAQVDAPGFFSSPSHHAMGHFDQCISARTDSFQGKYCTGFYTLLPNSTFYPNTTTDKNTVVSPRDRKSFLSLIQILGMFGKPLDSAVFLPVDLSIIFPYLPSVALCLPSTCNETDIQNAFADLVGSYSLANGVDELLTVTYAGDEYCYVDTKEAPHFDGETIAMISVLSVIGFLVVASTLYEALGGYFLGEPLLKSTMAKEKKYVSYFCVFSLINNTKKLMSTKTNDGALGCIHGIRLFSMTWVTIGHTWATISTGVNVNLAGIQGRIHNWFYQTILNSTPSVDSFFMLSGLLAAYLLLLQLDKVKGKFNPLMLYLHRYLRLTPVYAVILGFNATLIAYLGTGPFWYSVEGAAYACRKIWWQQLLYINNLVTHDLDEEGCMVETWYIAVDMQLFLIIPFVVYPLWRWKLWGLAWLALVTLGSLVANLVFFITEDVHPTIMVGRTDADNSNFNDNYMRPWYRAPSYLVGIFAGWLLYMTKKHSFKLSKPLAACGWACAIAVGCSVIYGLTPYATDDIELPKTVTAIYGSFHRLAWTAALAWVVYACVNGYGGYVNDLLSWKAFIPLGRLTYCVYLIHLNLLLVYAGQQKTQFYYTDLNNIYAYLGTLLMSLGLAFITAVTIETPFLMLEKMLLGEKPSKKTVQQKEVELEKVETADNGTSGGYQNEAYASKE